MDTKKLHHIHTTLDDSVIKSQIFNTHDTDGSPTNGDEWKSENKRAHTVLLQLHQVLKNPN